jgi:hypothetical protein
MGTTYLACSSLREVDDVLLAGDEGEVDREELLDDGRDHHLCSHPPAFQE